jgi:hypothetical protein
LTAAQLMMHSLKVKFNFISRMSSRFKGVSAKDNMSLKSSPRKRDWSHPPTEVLFIVISFVNLQDNSQNTLYSCCLVSRSWYSVAVVELYQLPVVKQGRMSLFFFRTMCLSQNDHNIKSSFSEYVKTLDLKFFDVHESVTERLLWSVEDGRRVFIGPETSFS